MRIVLAWLAAAGVALAAPSVRAEGEVTPHVQVRYRFEVDARDFSSSTSPMTFNLLRTRLGATFRPAEGVRAFVQWQDSRVLGEETSTLTDASGDRVDLHQGYLVVERLFDAPIDLTLGRFEQKWGAERLVGAVGWSNTGRSFDGAVATVHGERWMVDVFAWQLAEAMQPGDRGDLRVYGVRADVDRSKTRTAQAFLVWQRSTPNAMLSRATAGGYVRGRLGNFSYASDFGYQFGTITPDSVEQNVSALMATLSMWLAFPDVGGRPAVGVAVDFLSGDDDPTDGDWKVFDTMYATNHKWYGYMDYFLNIPVHTYGAGLVDAYGSLKVTPWTRTPLKVDVHVLRAHQDVALSGGGTSKAFGTEVDVTLRHRYHESVTFVLGGSVFAPGDVFKDRRGPDTSYWGYVMTIVTM